jgi:signal transduction histidine kinase
MESQSPPLTRLLSVEHRETTRLRADAGRSLVAGVLQASAIGGRNSQSGERNRTDVKFETEGQTQICSPAAEGAIYRIVQEALSNVLRHSKAKRATVRLVRGKANTHVVIADDGIGMPNEIRQGVGLVGMRSRLTELGGRLSIRSRSSGTAIIASIPVERSA